jgi:23S rRNA (adenine-N6)-dimethyltransferase
VAGRTGSRRWAWHRLSSRWAERIVESAGIRAGDLVLDVGAGDGALTRPLLQARAKVVAFELHHGRARELERRFASRGVKVVRADVADLRLPRRPFKVVANPPFTTHVALMKRLVGPGSRLVQADLVLPRHAAQRWAEGRGPGWGRHLAEYRFTVVQTIPRNAFTPPADKDPVVLRVSRRDAIDRSAGRAGPRPGTGRRPAR